MFEIDTEVSGVCMYLRRWGLCRRSVFSGFSSSSIISTVTDPIVLDDVVEDFAADFHWTIFVGVELLILIA